MIPMFSLLWQHMKAVMLMRLESACLDQDQKLLGFTLEDLAQTDGTALSDRVCNDFNV